KPLGAGGDQPIAGARLGAAVEREASVAVMIVEQPRESASLHFETEVRLANRGGLRERFDERNDASLAPGAHRRGQWFPHRDRMESRHACSILARMAYART